MDRARTSALPRRWRGRVARGGGTEDRAGGGPGSAASPRWVSSKMTSPPIVLVPGCWLGAWAWDEVAVALRADGHDVTYRADAPGLESADADGPRSRSPTMSTRCRRGDGGGPSVVLAVHSGGGALRLRSHRPHPGADRGNGLRRLGRRRRARSIDFDAVEKPLPSREIAEEENLDGLSEEHLETFRQRAVPAGWRLRDAAELTNDARLDVPSTVICTGFTSEQYKDAVEGRAIRCSPA